MGLLDDRSLQAQLSGADRSDVAAGAGTDDDDVEGCVGHAGSNLNFSCQVVGWAKAQRAVPTIYRACGSVGGHAALCPPYKSVACNVGMGLTAHTIIITGFSISCL